MPHPPRDPSPLDAFEPERRGHRSWVRPTLIGAAALALVTGAYVGASFAVAGRVPHGTTVAGLDLSGLSRADATATLTAAIADRSTQTIEVAAKDKTSTIVPADVGLAVDADATVAQLTGVDLAQPVRLWRQIVGGGEIAPVSAVDDTALATAMTSLGDALSEPAVDGMVVFTDGTPHVTDAADGWALDHDAAVETLTTAWLTDDSIALPTVVSHPDVTQDEAQAALSDQAVPLTKGRIVVDVGEASAALTTADLVGAAAFTVVDGDLALTMDGTALRDVIVAQLPDLLTPATDAHFDLSSGAPVIVAGVEGTTIDPDALGEAVVAASTTGTRTASVELTATDPSEGVEDLESLKVVEIVSEFSTPLNSEPRRTKNITTGAAAINGTLIRPGETFSLGEALGPVDKAHGFVDAGAIVDGNHQDAMGGGLSQLSTTTYNAAYEAGMQIVEHKPHSEYFARYPEGRESTLFYPQLDMKWLNNTPYGALVESWVEGGRLHVRIWSTTYWTVESVTSPRRGVVSPTTVYNESPSCSAQGAGNPGFSVTVTRTTSLGGEVVATESWDWTYKPQNRIVCSAPPGG